jgi:hypothetical protein
LLYKIPNPNPEVLKVYRLKGWQCDLLPAKYSETIHIL